MQVTQKDYQKAQETLSALVPVAERNAHNRHLVEILLVYADALAQEDRTEEAAVMLERALDRAENAGFLKLFAEESPSLRAMLLDCPRLRTPGRWNRELLTMLKDQLSGNADIAISKPQSDQPSETTDGLAEPLSQREQEVLLLINQGLANKDIAIRMAVAPATVKAHIRNLYGKLGVSRRTEALARARELKVLRE